MGEEVRLSEYDVTDHNRVTEWEAGLPNADDLPPLSQFLISSDLASAFSITPEPHRSMIDVDRASRDTLSSLRGQSQQHLSNKLNNFKSFSDDREEEMIVEGEETVDLTGDGSESRKLQRVDSGGAVDDSSGRSSKRIRLVWTPQLHKRFIEVVAHLGVKNAVPKTIMQMMNVEGLTRENVASHLQKYRLYVKRMQGSSNEGPSASDHLFASTPVPNSSPDSGGGSGGGSGSGSGRARVQIPMPYPPPQMVPNPYQYHHGFDPNSHPYNMNMNMNMMMQPRDWCGNNFGSVSPYQHRKDK